MQQEDDLDYDYEYDIDYGGVSLVKKNSSLNQEVLEIDDVRRVIEQLLIDLQELLNLDLDNTFEILLHYNWSKDEIEQQFLINSEQILQELKNKGVFNNHKKINYKTQIDTCIVCMIETELIQLGCGHRFCEQCIKQTISQKVNKEHSLVVRCLMDGCLYRMPYSMIKHFSNSEHFSKILCRRFTECSRYLAYCTGVDCQKIIKPYDTSSKDVTCSCGTKFCFRCKQDLHPPAPCDIVKKWIAEVTKDEANIKWIAINTKICPFCKKPVQRSEGCNYMMCKPPGGCGQAFCYVCSNPWEPDHRDHFKCNKYVPPENENQKEKEMLARYNFYYERFLNSQAALEKAELRLKDLREKLTALIFEIYEVTYTDAHFLEDAILEMIHSRIVLKWTYCLGYFLSQHNVQSAKLFDNYQALFEHACEQLAIELIQLYADIDFLTNLYSRSQKPIEERKAEFANRKELIQKACTKCHTLKKNLENAIYNGEINM